MDMDMDMKIFSASLFLALQASEDAVALLTPLVDSLGVQANDVADVLEEMNAELKKGEMSK